MPLFDFRDTIAASLIGVRRVMKTLLRWVLLTVSLPLLAAAKLPGVYATKIIHLNCKDNASVILQDKTKLHLHMVKINGKPGTRHMCYHVFNTKDKKHWRLRYIVLGQQFMAGQTYISADVFSY